MNSISFASLFDLLDSNPTEQDCINYLEKTIWKEKVVSPHDPTSEIYKCTGNKYKCKNTGKYFTARSLTIFRNSNLPLKKWFLALSFFASQRISSCQFAKHIKVTQKTAWFIEHRLRFIFENPAFKTKLGNSVEIDEAFLGGSNLNRHWNKKAPKTQGRNWKDKIPVLGMIEQNGNLICQVVPDTKRETLEPIIRDNIEAGTNVCTDEWLAYNNLGEWFNHQIVNHRKKQYVNGKTTTNRVENAWSHLKRSVYGTYFKVSKQHSQAYIKEFTFRFNTRKYSMQERFDLALSLSVGKRLTYRGLVGVN